jgi:hypothetical protein
MMRKNQPVGVVFKGLTKQKIQVLALESKRSVSWIVADFMEAILAQPEWQQRVLRAARTILDADPTYGPANDIMRQQAQKTQTKTASVLQPQTDLKAPQTIHASQAPISTEQPEIGDATAARGQLGRLIGG